MFGDSPQKLLLKEQPANSAHVGLGVDKKGRQERSLSLQNLKHAIACPQKATNGQLHSNRYQLQELHLFGVCFAAATRGLLTDMTPNATAYLPLGRWQDHWTEYILHIPALCQHSLQINEAVCSVGSAVGSVRHLAGPAVIPISK